MPNQRITLAQAKAILVASGTATTIAERFRVSHQTVRLYKNLQTALAREAIIELCAEGWDLVPLGPKSSCKFSSADITAIRSEEHHQTSKELAAHYGCSASMIRMIKTGKAYA